MLGLPTYVIVTPARNEADYIERTIKSVLAQSVRPLKWVIVSDGSTDGMDDIVRKYAAEHSWIELVRMPERRERHFSGKVHAFNAGYARMAGLQYDVIVNLDGDTSFDEDYFSLLLQKLAQDPQLGLVGGRLVDARSNQDYYDYKFTQIEHVSGACQIFRRGCFEEVGGYQPLKTGGIDLVAVLSARAKGWQTRTFTEKPYYHHRPMNGAQMKGMRERLHTGRKDYLLGSHPAWELFRSLYKMKDKPYVLGGFLVLIGYLWPLLRQVERTIPSDLLELRQKEQMQRLRGIFLRAARESVPLPFAGGHSVGGGD